MKHLLTEQSASILLIESRSKDQIVIAAPHHTPGGKKNMPCPEHADGDENTGYIAWMIAEQMNLCSVIACNYFIDPNKSLKTDYSSQIVQWNPKYLIEIHGHGAKDKNKLDNYTIEVSSGKKAREKIAIEFSNILEKQMRAYNEFQNYKVKGKWIEIYFKASKTATISDERWTPIHIELPPSLRLTSNNNLPDSITKFVNSLVNTIKQVCK